MILLKAGAVHCVEPSFGFGLPWNYNIGEVTSAQKPECGLLLCSLLQCWWVKSYMFYEPVWLWDLWPIFSMTLFQQLLYLTRWQFLQLLRRSGLSTRGFGESSIWDWRSQGGEKLPIQHCCASDSGGTNEKGLFSKLSWLLFCFRKAVWLDKFKILNSKF